ncbi:hypothetical protein Ciccas_009777 [Cichlidogyrus casuarinus]|uniref:Uncharacterized protein n=1 Tax=Cichlidogyrus casuarinus TaxID=1844966 RepID=A0ABD2PX28_9PLAT
MKELFKIILLACLGLTVLPKKAKNPLLCADGKRVIDLCPEEFSGAAKEYMNSVADTLQKCYDYSQTMLSEIEKQYAGTNAHLMRVKKRATIGVQRWQTKTDMLIASVRARSTLLDKDVNLILEMLGLKRDKQVCKMVKKLQKKTDKTAKKLKKYAYGFDEAIAKNCVSVKLPKMFQVCQKKADSDDDDDEESDDDDEDDEVKGYKNKTAKD